MLPSGIVIGERLGPYRIVELLGQGGLAEVYRAYHQEEAQDVAIKILRSKPDSHTLARFQREAEALKPLQHPNIIQVLSVGEHQGRPYYTMPFVRVLTLGEIMHQRWRVDGRQFTEDEVVRILIEVARALRYAHGRGIIHRDVKPDNILVDPNFRPILCDFGLARLGGHETMTTQGTMLGTPRYMAPEQLQGRRCDARSDLYSLGLVGYELITGKIPFDGGEPLASAVRRLTEPVPPMVPPKPLRPEVTELIQACLSIRTEDRPGGAGDFVRALESHPGAPPPLLEHESLDTVENRPQAVEQASPQKPVGWIIAGGLGASLLLAGPIFLWAGGKPQVIRCSARLTPQTTSASLDFESDSPTTLGVRYGLPGRLMGYADSPLGRATHHQLVLESLLPDTQYEFELVLSENDTSTHTEKPRQFRTAKRIRRSEKGAP